MNQENKALSPEEVRKKKVEEFEPDIIQAVNNLLVKNYNLNDSHGVSITILQKEVLEEFFKVKGIEQDEKIVSIKKQLFAEKQMDFEDLYRKVGWKVNFDKPGYDESYEPKYIFENK